MAVKNFVFRENWVGSKVAAGMKTTFLAIFDPTWTHNSLTPKGPSKEFLKGIVKWVEPCNVLFLSFQGYSDIRESTLLQKNGDFDIWYTPGTFRHNFSFQVYAARFQWRLLIYIGKNLWRTVLEANKKQVPLKSYSPEIRVDSVNQILKSKEKNT